jgi:heat shock protein HslJ
VVSRAQSAASAITGSGGPASSADGIEGHTFAATAVSGTYTMAPGSTISLTFADGRVSVRGGCNNMSGSYTVNGDVLTVGTLASTMMACDQALMDQDTWLSAFLSSSPTWTYQDGVLTLTNGTDTLVMSAPVVGAAALDATGWKLDGLITKTADANSVSAVDPSLTAWIRFAGGQVAFNTSCNTGAGPADVGETTIVYDVLAVTQRACTDPSGSTEQVMLSVLQGETPYSLTDNPSGALLVIMSADDTKGLQFVADPTVGADAFSSAPPTG